MNNEKATNTEVKKQPVVKRPVAPFDHTRGTVIPWWVTITKAVAFFVIVPIMSVLMTLLAVHLTSERDNEQVMRLQEKIEALTAEVRASRTQQVKVEFPRDSIKLVMPTEKLLIPPPQVYSITPPQVHVAPEPEKIEPKPVETTELVEKPKTVKKPKKKKEDKKEEKLEPEEESSIPGAELLPPPKNRKN